MENQNTQPETKKDSLHTPKVFKDTARMVDKTLQIQKHKQAVFTRFPLLFTLLGAFGLVATFYGFEGVIDRVGLAENPWILLAIGLIVLVFTGTLYKKLGD